MVARQDTRKGKGMSYYVVIGQSPFQDVAVGVGPYRSATRAREASASMAEKGWNTEIVELSAEADIPYVTNDEGN